MSVRRADRVARVRVQHRRAGRPRVRRRIEDLDRLHRRARLAVDASADRIELPVHLRRREVIASRRHAGQRRPRVGRRVVHREVAHRLRGGQAARDVDLSVHGRAARGSARDRQRRDRGPRVRNRVVTLHRRDRRLRPRRHAADEIEKSTERDERGVVQRGSRIRGEARPHAGPRIEGPERVRPHLARRSSRDVHEAVHRRHCDFLDHRWKRRHDRPAARRRLEPRNQRSQTDGNRK